MGIDDALRAADLVGVNKIVGVHYDTFPPIKIDRDAALKAAKAAGKELLLPAIGETIERLAAVRPEERSTGRVIDALLFVKFT